MLEGNNKNLLYFEASSMAALYESMDDWQEQNHKRLLSVSIQPDGEKFCCIALTNPSEVVIKGMDWGTNSIGEASFEFGRLRVAND